MSAKQTKKSQPKNELNETYQEAKKLVRGSSTKQIILMVLSFVFPAGGLMLAYHHCSDKSDNKLAKAYLFIALASIIIGAILRLTGILLRGLFWSIWW